MMAPEHETDPEQETLFWLSQPGIHKSIEEAKADVAAGRTFDENQVREKLRLPARTT